MISSPSRHDGRLRAREAFERNKKFVKLTTPETFCDVFERLAQENVRYVVISGIAVVLHGHARPVIDLDIVVCPAPAEASRAMNALARGGFVPSIPLPLNMVTVLRMFDGAGREIDVFARYHIPFDDLWEHSEHKRVGRSLVRVVSLEHLLRTKRINGRPHDLLDIEALEALAASSGAQEEQDSRSL